MNDFKYVLINFIFFLMLSCGMVMQASDFQQGAQTRNEQQTARNSQLKKLNDLLVRRLIKELEKGGIPFANQVDGVPLTPVQIARRTAEQAQQALRIAEDAEQAQRVRSFLAEVRRVGQQNLRLVGQPNRGSVDSTTLPQP